MKILVDELYGEGTFFKAIGRELKQVFSMNWNIITSSKGDPKENSNAKQHETDKNKFKNNSMDVHRAPLFMENLMGGKEVH